jgi:hypothetical protein
MNNPDVTEKLNAPAASTPASGSVLTCEVCGRPMTEKKYEHGEDKRTYWTCDLAEGAWAHGCQHTAEDAPENRKAPNDKDER